MPGGKQEKASEIRLLSPDGKEIKLSDIKGKDGIIGFLGILVQAMQTGKPQRCRGIWKIPKVQIQTRKRL